MTSERQNENWKRYYSKNKERINERRRELAKDKPIRVRDYVKESDRVARRKESREGWLHYALINARHRAKKKGLAFNIELGDIDLPDVCPVLGVPLVYGTRDRSAIREVENIPTLDRTRNSLGYTKGNVKVISARANSLKSNADLAEIKRLLAYMEQELDD